MRSTFRKSSVSYWWTFNSKKFKPEKALTLRKHWYCAVVELTILRKTTLNRTASKKFYLRSSASGACKQSGTFYWINDFYNFFERGVQWMRKIKTVTPVEQNGYFLPNGVPSPPQPHFLILRRPFYGMEFGTLFCLLLYVHIVHVSLYAHVPLYAHVSWHYMCLFRACPFKLVATSCLVVLWIVWSRYGTWTRWPMWRRCEW